VLKKVTITGIVLLIALSVTWQAFAQVLAPGLPGTPTGGRLGYWELASLGKIPSSGPVDVPVYNPYCAFGPYGIHGQYSIYGPYGMYGPGGPGYGSGLGFNGFGMHDPWTLFKDYNVEKAIQAASGSEKAPAPKAAGGVNKSTNAAVPAKGTASPAGANATAG
jgi:hypothetical protein